MELSARRGGAGEGRSDVNASAASGSGPETGPVDVHHRLDRIAENRLLAGWTRTLSRRADQVNAPHEADCEIVPLPGGELCLALTVDTVVEELELGFYRDPETMGWMAATVSLSDLAAVGAEPLGLLVSATLPPDEAAALGAGALRGGALQAGIAQGLEEACRASGTHVLGGDTNVGPRLALGSSAAGIVPRDRVLLRTGCRAGERLYATGPLGAGAGVAARAVLGRHDTTELEPFRPRARTREARLLRRWATSCMDTSDGLIATLDQLARLNGVGFEVTLPPGRLLVPEALRLSAALGLDPLVMVAQPHGEFELVFTVRETRGEAFERNARNAGFASLRLGRVTRLPLLRFPAGGDEGGSLRTMDGARIRNLLDEVGGDLSRYGRELVRLVSPDGRALGSTP